MSLFLLSLLLLVIAGAALVAAGRGARLGPAVPDPGPGPLADGVPRGGDLEALRFGVGLRGYRMDEVDAALDVLEAALAERDRRLAVLEARLGLRADDAVVDPSGTEDGSLRPAVPDGPRDDVGLRPGPA